MVFTTHFGLHSQANRLLENASQGSGDQGKDGILTLCDASFQRTYPWTASEDVSINYNSHGDTPRDFKFELFPLHSQLLGESSLVSFPPLIDMLKFSGFSYLI